MNLRIVRLAGIVVMVIAVLVGVQLLAGLGFAYFLRFGSPSGAVDGPLHHWHPADTFGALFALVFPSVLFVVGFYLKRLGTNPPFDDTPRRTAG